ncbi:hypothetical protein N0V82_000354 [Gnomoniopsis sp. IMI 355080]|nr:hypothetical protein N0V82_000354 [Gnomoniopsis sp. IMI 355080]
MRQNRSGFVSLRDDHRQDRGDERDDDDDDDDDDNGKQKNRLQQTGGDGDDDDDDRKTIDGQRNTPPPPPPNPLTAFPTALTPLLPSPTTLTPSLPTLITSLPSLTSTTTSSSSISILTTSSLTTSSTTTSSTSSSQAFSTLKPLPTASTAPAPAALNPQVVTISSVTIMTTTSVVPVVATSSPSSFITSLFPSPSSTTTQLQSATAAFDTTPPSPTIFISDTGDHHDDAHRDGPPPGGLSPTAEDVLISAGSIGAFILICFVCWMGLRMYKKRERAKQGMDGDDFSSPNALLAKIPYFGRNQRAWEDLDAAEMRRSASTYQTSGKSMGPTVSIYSMNSRRDMAQPAERQGPMALPQLDTNVGFSPMSYAQINPFSATVSSPSGTIQSRNTQSPQSSLTQRNFPYAEQQYPAALPPIQTRFSPDNVVNNPFASPEDPPVVTSVSPNSATQYGGGGTMETVATTGTDRSRMPGFFNQSELARTASAAYDPATRAVYRASELSSISSGFGDGDIIVPPMATLQQGQDPRPYSFAKSSGSRSRANSVATRSEVGSNGQRDTIYTTTSEDMPTRYRSVNSWVNQQTGRVERQQRRDTDEEIPPVPILPPEQRLTMMMDDGEEPRRYEDTLSSQPPLPALPTQNDVARP